MKRRELPTMVRDDVVAERQREGENGAGDDAGQRQGKDHRPERLPWLSAEIRGCFDVVGGHTLQRRLDRQDHVGNPDVDEDQERADVAERQRRAADHRQCQNSVEQP